MDLVDPQGKPLDIQERQKKVADVLEQLKPKNKEQEAILARAIGEKIEKQRKLKMGKGLKEGFGKTFKENYKTRQDGGASSPSKDWKLLAVIPQEMAYVARQIWGEDVFTDPQKFNEAFVKDEMGQYCLTVDPKTI